MCRVKHCKEENENAKDRHSRQHVLTREYPLRRGRRKVIEQCDTPMLRVTQRFFPTRRHKVTTLFTRVHLWKVSVFPEGHSFSPSITSSKSFLRSSERIVEAFTRSESSSRLSPPTM